MDIGKVSMYMVQEMKDLNLSDKDFFILARWTYSIGQPIMEDAEYTQLLDAMTAMSPDDEYVNRSWSSDPCPTELLKRIGHEEWIYAVVLSDKTESIPSLNSEYDFRNELEKLHKPATLSMKLDGWNIQINYYNGNIVNIKTRGRSSDAVDVTALNRFVPQTIPIQGKCKIVCELTISKSSFQICKVEFGNVSSRSAVSTVLARPNRYDLLSITAFDIHGCDLNGRCKFDVLKDCGFSTPPFYIANDFEGVRESLKLLSDEADEYDQPTDGVVYDGEVRRAIRLMHWEEPIYKSYVTGYMEQYGPYRISPSVLIRPVYRQGYEQKRLSMTNWQRIIDYDLEPGAPVAFRIASSATADFDEVSTRLLHEQWKDNWAEYQTIINRNEDLARWVNG